MKKKIYRTIIRFEILSEDPVGNSIDLDDINYKTKEGECSGQGLGYEVKNEVLTGKEAAEAYINQGSDTEFFGMDEEGNEIED